jgi:DNA-directed RNA polymerase subunit RPC12/RpoP
VTVPVLHWVDRAALAAAEAETGAVRFCPYCGREVVGVVGVDLRCARCGRDFTIAAAEVKAELSVNLT